MRIAMVSFGTLCVVACSLAADAQAIHKCLAPEGTVYQSAPCSSGASDIVIASAASSGIPSTSRAAERPEPPETTPRRAASSGARRAFWRTSIAIGMSDDEVLNLPSWGRPSAITRSKFNRIWHEEWLYRWRIGGTSRLSFANGRLTAVETGAGEAAPETQVSLTLR